MQLDLLFFLSFGILFLSCVILTRRKPSREPTWPCSGTCRTRAWGKAARARRQRGSVVNVAVYGRRAGGEDKRRRHTVGDAQGDGVLVFDFLPRYGGGMIVRRTGNGNGIGWFTSSGSSSK